MAGWAGMSSIGAMATALAVRGTRVAVPRRSAIVGAVLAAGLLFASALLQLRAANARWIEYPRNRPVSERFEDNLSVEDHQFDYIMRSDDHLVIPDTLWPFGVGMLLQAAAILVLLLVQLAAYPPVERWLQALALVLVLPVAGNSVLAGWDSLLAHQDAPYPVFNIPEPQAIWLGWGLLAGVPLALLALVVLSWRWCPLLAVGWFFMLGTTVAGLLVSYMLIVPLLTFYSSHDTTPGTETFMAFTTAASALCVLLAAAGLALRRTRFGARFVLDDAADDAADDAPAPA